MGRFGKNGRFNKWPWAGLAFNPKAAVDDSKRPPEAKKSIQVFDRAKIDWAIDTLNDVSEGTFSLIVGEPN
jgi:hypothetical protein